MTGKTAFLDLARLFEALEATTKRNKKRALISCFIQQLDESELQPALSFLIGRSFPEADARTLEVGYKVLEKTLKDTNQDILVKKELTILTVSQSLNEISKIRGKGSRRKKLNLVKSLFRQATSIERKYLIRIILGEMRIGVVEGVTLEAIADAASVELRLVRRANMLMGDLGEVAKLAIMYGEEGLKKVNLTLFTPIKPMLAQTCYNLEDVFTEHGEQTSLEYKYDGARVQIHLKEEQVKIFSRRLSDVTKSIPEIVEVVKKQIFSQEALLEGEVVGYGDDNKPLPFQDLMKRFRRIHQIEVIKKKIPLRLYLFDVLYLNGELLIDIPYYKRWEKLSTICRSHLLAKRLVTNSIAEAKIFFESALRQGHEGLMAKALESNYTSGRRGKRWLKIKPVETLDLVITAADWGHGRRTGWLSNYHLATINKETGKYFKVGKTFKGLTDDQFNEMTNRLIKIKINEIGYTLIVKPEIVVEVAFNEIQRSSQYKSGFALRFARIKRIRDDKDPENADTLNRIRELYAKQFKFKAKLKNS